MTIELKNAKNGDKFEAKNGLKMTYNAAEDNPFYAPYQFCLKSEETGTSYFYSNEGEYYKGENPEMNLVDYECTTPTEDKINTQVPHEIERGWETVLKVISWFILFGCLFAFFRLIGEDHYYGNYYGSAFIVLAVGIIQLVINSIFANISISLKEANALKKNILEEMKKMNKN